MKMASSSFRIVLSLNSAPTDQKLNPGKPSSLLNNQTIPESDSKPEVRKLKCSSQLNRWSMSRGLRAGWRMDRPVRLTHTSNLISPVQKGVEDDSVLTLQGERQKGIGREDNGEMTEGKAIFMVSDGTGWTVEHSVNAALGQFEHCLVAGAGSVNTHLFSGVDNVERLVEIVKKASKEGAMLFYTLADPSMAKSANQACNLWGVPCTNVLSPITDAIATHLQASPSNIVGGSPIRKLPLTEEYFRRIEAVEFTIKHDDGALPQNLHKADIVLAGVSRTGKTPLSICLAQKGYKVANVPIVMGVELPKTLFEIDPEKVFGLTINPMVLQTIRRSRAKTLRFADDMSGSYSEMVHVREELEFAGNIFARNPVWPIIEVTGKAIEETATVLLRLYRDRKQKCLMPQISRRY